MADVARVHSLFVPGCSLSKLPIFFQSYITDKGYDVDLFFDLGGNEGHIYSDVEGHEMMNYFLLNGEIKGQDYQVETNPPDSK